MTLFMVMLLSSHSRCDSLYVVNLMNSAPSGCRPLDQSNQLEFVNRIRHRHFALLPSSKADNLLILPTSRRDGYAMCTKITTRQHPW